MPPGPQHNSSLPVALPVGQALAQSAAWSRLAARLQESNARFALVVPLLPPALAAQLQPGPLDEDGRTWTLLAANAAVAAKLRQWVPRLDAALTAQGRQGSAIRIRVQSR